MVAKTPQQKAAVERLRAWALSPEAARHFRWGTDHDMTRCMRFYRGKMPQRMIGGWCYRLHLTATGHKPGHEKRRG